jgi:hypothetical protein
MAYANTLQFATEARRLKNLMDQVAAKCTELATLTMVTNATAEGFIQMPSAIGNKQYWLRLRNNSANAWIEGGFGSTALDGTDLRVYLPQETSAAGFFLGGHGAAHIECNAVAGALHITLGSKTRG